MASRFDQKPDPATKRNVIRSRQGARGAKRLQGMVVTASLAATMMGWAVFSQQDAQAAVTAQATDTSSVVAVATVQQEASVSPTAIITAAPANTSAQVTAQATATAVTTTAQVTVQATATPVTTTAQTTVSSTPVAVAMTRSSR